MSSLRHRDRVEGDLVVEVAFTASALDLGDAAPATVREHALDRVARETGASPVLMRQVHGAAVVRVDAATAIVPDCDALVTDQTGLALLARAADCVPVLLADPSTGWLAAVHSGRPGLAAGVVPAAVARVRELGGEPRVAWVGPHVCGACYEVPEQLRDDVAALVPEAAGTTAWGTPSLDIGAGVRAQLAMAGVADVRELGACTRETAEWPSYRRDGERATRFAGVIWSHR